ncbi:uncharacterized protein LOC121050596 [Rosa chinensis]|uniref:uncharacterized protein LOC121050596 n=1 Tax=Rosa chinensis TaxID=74649 RepID=UPI001AD91DA8|nr:uncharacterized protein LOC121050596 [Rosa chinensis]
MSNEPRLDFQMLDSTGSEYYSWVTDVENHLTSKGILPIIQAPDPGLVFQRTPTKHAQAIILMRRHMDKALRLEYMSMKDARELWVALEERFGNIQDTLLPDLKVQWNNIRFSDFKSVAEYNSEALRLKAMLKFCGKPLTEDELLEKTLSTIPVSAIVISKCGSIEHWFKQCHASTKLAASYKEYRQNREQESNLAENEDSEDVNLTIEDFKAEQMHEDAADFD